MKKPKWSASLTILIAFVSFCAVAAEFHVNTVSMTDKWPMFCGDSARSGYSTNTTGPTGNVAKIWNYTTGNGLFKAVRSSPAVVDGVVYVGSNDGFVYALDAFNGVQIWNYSTGASVSSSPAVVDGVVYVGSYDDNVYALDAYTGAKIWNYTTGDYVFSSPAVENGYVYVGSYDDNVYALNASTGAKIWNYSTGAKVYSSPAVANGFVYVGSSDLHCLDASTGIEVWRCVTESIFASPAVVSDCIYVVSTDFTVYCVSVYDGSIVWQYAVGGRDTHSSPAVAYKNIYAGSGEPYDGNVYCIGTPSAMNNTSSVTPPAGSIVVPDDYATIQEAIDNAPVGGTVFVRTGMYYAPFSGYPITINKSLSLTGEDSQNTMIVGIFPINSPSACPVIKVVAEYVTVSGFTIKSGSAGVEISGKSSRCKIIDNNIVNNGNGIYVFSHSPYIIISGNNITANKNDGIIFDADNSVICENKISGNLGDAILFSASNSIVCGNDISDNAGAGILAFSSNSIFYGNVITKNGWTALAFADSGNVTIASNNISDNPRGLELGNGFFYVHGNNIINNQEYGIKFTQDCTNTMVYQNNILQNDIGIEVQIYLVDAYVAPDSRNTVYQNNFVDNSKQVVIEAVNETGKTNSTYELDTNSVLWDNTTVGNYWNNYDGLDADGDGIGDTSYIIDENNQDNHPLMGPVEITPTPAPNLEPYYSTPNVLPTFEVILAFCIIVILAIFFIIYNSYRKRNRQTEELLPS